MPSTTLKPNTNIRLQYRVPDSGFVEFEIDADSPVASYIVRPKGLDLFDRGSTRFRYYGGFPDARKYHRQFLKLPFAGTFYLLIVNEGRRTIGIDYSVYLPR